MEKTWIEFLKAFNQPESGEGDTLVKAIDFKVGDIVELEKATADSLIGLNMAKASSKPDDDNSDIAKLQKSITGTIQNLLEKAFKDINKNLGDKIPDFASAKDHNSLAEYGWKDSRHFFKAVHAHETGDKSFDGIEYLSKAPSGQSIGSDAEGNLLVPEPVADGIWDNMMEEPDSVLPLTLGMTTAGTSMKIRVLRETSRKTGAGQRNGGIIAYWVEEAGALTSSSFTTGTQTLELHKLAALTYATDEILSDSGFDMQGFFNKLVPRAINYEVSNALFNGSGSGKPYGILKTDALIKVPALDFNGNAIPIDQLSHQAISDMYWRNSSRAKAIWYAHPSTAQVLEFLTFQDDTTNKRPIYFPAGGMGTGGLTQALFGSMYNRPVVPMEFMPNINQACTIALLDWSDYATLTKSNGGMKFASSIHVRFLNDEMAFRWTFRIDGRSLWTAPKEDLIGTVTRGPYTSIAAVDTDEGTSSGL